MIETCIHCRERVVLTGPVLSGEFVHWHGDLWCHDAHGFTRTPLMRAQPAYHGPKDVL